jgi:hypothetical protein
MKTLLTHLHQLAGRFTLPTILSTIALAIILPLTTGAAFAQTTNASGTGCNGNVQCIINFGNQRIAERVASLNTLNNKITTQLNAKHITSDQASVLQADVSSNLSNLSALQSKLDAETTASAARQDVMNIYVQFRIYAVVLPRDYREIHTDIANNLDNYLKNEESELQQQISSAPADKQQQLNALFSDYSNQVSDAAGQIDTAQAGFPTLTPSTYNNNRSLYTSTLASVTAADQAAHLELHRAVADLDKMNDILSQ